MYKPITFTIEATAIKRLGLWEAVIRTEKEESGKVTTEAFVGPGYYDTELEARTEAEKYAREHWHSFHPPRNWAKA